jgi:hypothetical protein
MWFGVNGGIHRNEQENFLKEESFIFLSFVNKGDFLL